MGQFILSAIRSEDSRVETFVGKIEPGGALILEVGKSAFFLFGFG